MVEDLQEDIRKLPIQEINEKMTKNVLSLKKDIVSANIKGDIKRRLRLEVRMAQAAVQELSERSVRSERMMKRSVLPFWNGSFQMSINF